MDKRIAVRAAAAALGLVVACSGVAFADSVGADADSVTTGNQTLVNLGTVGAGAVVHAEVAFELACLGTSHADVGTTLSLTPTTTPATGGSMTATAATLGPVPASWPVDGDPCVDDPLLRGSDVSHVTITAPTAAGTFVYKVTYAKSPSGGVTGSTTAQFSLSVAANSAPVVDHPGDMTVEGDTLGGWNAAFTASATDAEDDPDPDVACTPAPGDLLPLGTTTVTCSATDTGGLTGTGSFDITVVDTTAPALGTMADIAVSTADPGGAAVTFTVPTAVDVVDGPVAATCDAASGSTFPVGSTVVRCSASDASGNGASTQFTVAVELAVGTPAAVVTWLPPVSDGMTVQPGRTLPLKATVTVGGLPLTGSGPGTPALRLERLDGAGAVVETMAAGPFAWADGTWMRSVDTSALAPGTWRAVLVLDGRAAGEVRFTMAPRGNGPNEERSHDGNGRGKAGIRDDRGDRNEPAGKGLGCRQRAW